MSAHELILVAQSLFLLVAVVVESNHNARTTHIANPRLALFGAVLGRVLGTITGALGAAPPDASKTRSFSSPRNKECGWMPFDRRSDTLRSRAPPAQQGAANEEVQDAARQADRRHRSGDASCERDQFQRRIAALNSRLAYAKDARDGSRGPARTASITSRTSPRARRAAPESPPSFRRSDGGQHEKIPIGEPPRHGECVRDSSPLPSRCRRIDRSARHRAWDIGQVRR